MASDPVWKPERSSFQVFQVGNGFEYDNDGGRQVLLSQCRRGDLNPHESCPSPDFESGASANSATPARLKTNYLRNPNTLFFSVEWWGWEDRVQKVRIEMGNFATG